MSGAHRLAAGELTLDGNKNKRGKEYLDAVEYEMNEVDEGSSADLKEDKKEGEDTEIKNIGK